MSDAVVEILLDLLAARPVSQAHPAYARWESAMGRFILDLPAAQRASSAELVAQHLRAQLVGMPLMICHSYVNELLRKAGSHVG